MTFDTLTWQSLAWFAAAGACGTLARFGLSGFVFWLTGGNFPWGTFAVNALGCFTFGIIWAMAEHKMAISLQMRWILLSGFLGAFTTFSSYAFEAQQMIDESRWLWLVAQLLLHNVSGLLLVAFGIALGRWL